MGGRRNIISKRFIGSSGPLNPEQSGGFITISADFTSDELNVRQTDVLSLHLEWQSSTLIADVKIQARNGDADTDYWRDLEFSGAIAIAGASGSHEIILSQMPFTDVRVFIDVTSGSGDVGCSFTAKSIGS